MNMKYNACNLNLTITCDMNMKHYACKLSLNITCAMNMKYNTCKPSLQIWVFYGPQISGVSDF